MVTRLVRLPPIPSRPDLPTRGARFPHWKSAPRPTDLKRCSGDRVMARLLSDAFMRVFSRSEGFTPVRIEHPFVPRTTADSGEFPCTGADQLATLPRGGSRRTVLR